MWHKHGIRRRQWHPTPVLLPGKSHGWRSLVGCGPRSVQFSRSVVSDSLQSMGSLRIGHDWTTSLSLFTFMHWRRKSILAWRILGTGEPGGLPSMGSHRVGHDWSDLAAAFFYFFLLENGMWFPLEHTAYSPRYCRWSNPVVCPHL